MRISYFFLNGKINILAVAAAAVGEVGIPPLLRDFQARGESQALGLFHGAASSTALLTHE